MKGQIWETRPLESWKKAKELRARWQKSISSKETIVGQGSPGNGENAHWDVAFPAVTVIEDNPNGSMICYKDDRYARLSRLACEIRGWGREICGYHGNCWGGQFLGYDIDGSPFPYRKFVTPFPCVCDSHAKRGAQVRDFSPVPQWMLDQTIYFGERDPEREIAMNEHKNYCFLKQFNDFERIFGQKFDDERYIQQIKNRHLLMQYRTDISRLMAQTIPSPLSVKDLYSYFTLAGSTGTDPQEIIDFWKFFRDEVKWRAENHIAAVGNERYRWLEAHPPSWHYLKYYRYMEKYGAVCIGSTYTHGLLIRLPDGTIVRRPRARYPEDIPLETREDIVRFMNGPDAREPVTFKIIEYLEPLDLNEIARMFQVDGAILALWRCGVGCVMTRKQQAMNLREIGLSVLHYEGSQPGDRTDLDEKRFLDQLDSWMQSQGLQKLED